MASKALQVYDPPLCCSTGVCGPDVDPELVRFAADLHWLESHGVSVERFNLAQQPAAFAGNPAILELLNAEGTASLPAIVVAEAIVSSAAYPSRDELAALVGLEQQE